MVRDLQTHDLPTDRRALVPLARSMGLDGPEHLQAEHARHAEIVRGLHERLFYRPLLEGFAAAPVPRARTGPVDTEDLVAGLGFGDPVGARRTLASLVDPGFRWGKVLGTLFPVVARGLAFAAAPDAGLVRFGRVVEALRRDERLADRMADRPDAARRLV